MPNNRRRHANTVPIAKFIACAVTGIFLCAAGLGYVWCKNDINTTGTQLKKLEVELLAMRSRNEASRTRIAELTSTAELNRRFASGWIKLVPIAPDRIVPVGAVVNPADGGELRAVSNDRRRE